jgi:hypothetical protein
VAAVSNRQAHQPKAASGNRCGFFSGKETRLEKARPKNNAAIIDILSNEPLGAKLPARKAVVQFVWEIIFDCPAHAAPAKPA